MNVMNKVDNFTMQPILEYMQRTHNNRGERAIYNKPNLIDLYRWGKNVVHIIKSFFMKFIQTGIHYFIVLLSCVLGDTMKHR